MRFARRWLTCRLAAVVMGLACVVLTAGPATADDGSLLVDIPGDGVGFSHDLGVPLLNVQRLYPGSTGSGTMEVRNSSQYDAHLVLVASDIVDHENDCLRPETREPGEECGADGGELGDWLEVTVTRGADADQVTWRGDLGALGSGADLGSLPADATQSLRIEVALPQAATNDTMTDAVTFDLRLTATSAAGESSVDAPEVQVGAGVSPPSGPDVTLPFVGGTVSRWWLLVDAAVLLLGAVLVVASRRGRRTSLAA